MVNFLMKNLPVGVRIMIRSLYKRSLIISSYHRRIKSNLFVDFQTHATTHKRIVMNV